MDGHDLVDWIYFFLIEEGKQSYTPDEVRDIIRNRINEIYEAVDNKWYKKD